MRAIVEIRLGPLQGRKAVLNPGRTLRLGRGELADLVVPGDRAMSALHCELGWDGERCTVRDLKSARGTWIDGEQVREGEVGHGHWIRAGDTIAMVYVEEKTPPRPGADVAMTPQKAQVLSALHAEAAPLFAVLDAARDPRILEVLRESAEPYRSLYEGIQAEGLAQVAPYLVGLPRGCRLLERLVREGWGKRWGIYLTSKRPFREVRTELRRYLMVEDEVGASFYFRFYDPATIRVFLPLATPRQRGEFFSEIERFCAEGEGAELLSWGKASERA
jgi:pSer/pThr/pTyr-binding forkhead associated (FHA) protein